MDIRYSCNQKDFKRYTTEETRDEFLITGLYKADGTEYHLNRKDCLYITQGTKEVTFRSLDENAPAKFYMVSAPAHTRYETKLITIEEAAKRPLGSMETCNKRTINQFIHPNVLKTCQLSMGMTCLDPGSNWNTMPSHTHERRMEIYTYFDLPEGQVVFHMCGENMEFDDMDNIENTDLR